MMEKPSKEQLWYAMLTEWDGEKCLLTNGGRIIVGRASGLMLEGAWGENSPKEPVIVGFGDTPPRCVSLIDLCKEEEASP